MNIESKDITGTFPSEPCVFAACDSKYFMDHASSFCNSAYKAGMPCHIHIVNPTEEVHEHCDIFKQKIFTLPNVVRSCYGYVDFINRNSRTCIKSKSL